MSIEAGYAAAKACCVGLLSTLKTEIGIDLHLFPVLLTTNDGGSPPPPLLGDLDNVIRIVKVTGMVNSPPAFIDHPKVINGCSDLLVEAFQEKGKHARVAAGYVGLPLGVAVEIDMIVEVK